MARTVYNAPNPFDQSLNTTDHVTFDTVEVSKVMADTQVEIGGLPVVLDASNDEFNPNQAIGWDGSNYYKLKGKQVAGVALDTTQYIELELNGTPLKLALVN